MKLALADLTITGPGANFRGGGNFTGTAEGGQFPTRFFLCKKGGQLGEYGRGANFMGGSSYVVKLLVNWA